MLPGGLHDRRAHLRINSNFGARISKFGLLRPASGVAENISQRGAFVRTEDWHAFAVKDQAIVAILIPASFSGQEVPVELRGTAVVTRLDRQRGGVALHFERDFKLFERVNPR
jgi:hypothetical protein